MEELKETKKFVVKWSMAMNLLIVLLLAVFFDLRSAYGFFVGGIMSIINFYLLAFSLQKAVKFSPHKAQAYIFIQYIFRYILWFFAFYIAMKRTDVNLLTTILGMFTVKFIILSTNIFKTNHQQQEIMGKEGK